MRLAFRLIGSVATSVLLYLLVSAARAGALAMPDWFDAEIVLVLAMGAGGVYTMWAEGRAHRREMSEMRALAERIATVETAIGSAAPHSIAERVSSLEGAADEAPDTIELFERVAKLEAGRDIAERMAVLEARADHQPWKHTRRKDGKFASADTELATCESPKPRKEAPR